MFIDKKGSYKQMLKKYLFLGALWFFENENFDVREAKFTDFLKLNS